MNYFSLLPLDIINLILYKLDVRSMINLSGIHEGISLILKNSTIFNKLLEDSYLLPSTNNKFIIVTTINKNLQCVGKLDDNGDIIPLTDGDIILAKNLGIWDY